jgi:Bacterial membrane protein YfhO
MRRFVDEAEGANVTTESDAWEQTGSIRTGLAIGISYPQAVAWIYLIIQPLVFYWRVLFSKTGHIPYDLHGFHFPLAAFIARCVRQHTWPFWDPYPYCGAPIHADITAQLFYPLTWITLLIGNLSNGAKLYYYYQWLIPLHMIIGGFFTFYLLRRLRCGIPASLFGATVYELGAYFASQAQHLGAVSCGAWFPLALICVLELADHIRKRWVGILALSFALSFLAGFPASTVVVFAITGLFALGLIVLRLGNWRLIPLLAFACLLGLAMSAVQLVPTMELTRLSIASLRSSFRLSAGGLPIQSLVSFVWPNYYHIFSGWSPAYRLPYNFTFMYIYCGHAAVILLALLIFVHKSKEIKICSAILVVSTIWMLGDQAYIYKIIDKHLPQMMRGAIYCEFALMSFTLFVGLASALTLESMGHFLKNWKTPVFWLVTVITSINLLLVGSNRPMNEAHGSYKTINSETSISGRADILAELYKLSNVAYPPTRTDFTPDSIHSLRTGAELFRLPSAGGDNPFMLLRYYHFRHLFAPSVPWDRRDPLTTGETPWISALNIGLIIQNINAPTTIPIPEDGYDRVKLFPWILAYVNKNPLPRFYLTDKVRTASDSQSALKLLGDRDFQVGREAIVESATSIPVSGNPGKSFVQIVDYANNRVELHIRADGPLYLVSSEAYYPGWRAAVNGSSAPLYPTNVAFRGLPIPAGDSRVVMSYWPENLRLLCVVTIISVMICMALILWPTRAPKQI